jgi:hypothetical protein
MRRYGLSSLLIIAAGRDGVQSHEDGISAEHRVVGSLAPSMQNFTLTVFLPLSSTRYNCEIINESMG